MIEPDPTAFPGCIIDTLSTTLNLIDAEIPVHRRPLRTSDDMQCIGIFATDWSPDPSSFEMHGGSIGGMGEMFPTLSEYVITIQSLVRDTEEERGIATHAALSTVIRSTVARDADLRLALGQLASSVSGHTEQARRWEVRRQRYLTMELSGSWIYMSVTQFWLQTQSS